MADESYTDLNSAPVRDIRRDVYKIACMKQKTRQMREDLCKSNGDTIARVLLYLETNGGKLVHDDDEMSDSELFAVDVTS